MHKIQDLFDPSKKLNRTIESVVTFGAKTEQDLSSEIRVNFIHIYSWIYS